MYGSIDANSYLWSHIERSWTPYTSKGTSKETSKGRSKKTSKKISKRTSKETFKETVQKHVCFYIEYLT